MTDRLAELEARMRRVHESEQFSNVVKHPSSPPEPKKHGHWRDHAFTAGSLQNETFPEIQYVVAGLVPEGLSISLASPKSASHGSRWNLP
jgi:hypothetical protein